MKTALSSSEADCWFTFFQHDHTVLCCGQESQPTMLTHQ